MHDAFNIVSPAPNTQHTAHFIFSGEIRFGPPYYALSVDAYSFGQRIFGAAHLWSPSSTLLAVQEWLTLDYSEGPITALILLDLALGREACVSRATKRFIVPEAFEGPIMKYREDYAGQATIEHFDLDTTKIKEWKELA
jgi:hypothetical protein